MATRSLIGIKNEDGSVEVIYCHWDGYPEYVGLQLLLNYNNEETVRKLISLGDRSSLIGTPDYENSYANLQNQPVIVSKYDSMQEFYDEDKAGAEFVYIYDKATGWTIYKAWADGALENMGPIKSIKIEYEWKEA